MTLESEHLYQKGDPVGVVGKHGTSVAKVYDMSRDGAFVDYGGMISHVKHDEIQLPLPGVTIREHLLDEVQKKADSYHNFVTEREIPLPPKHKGFRGLLQSWGLL